MVASIPNDRPVRFAVVGVGQISQQAFIPGLSRIDDAELADLVARQDLRPVIHATYPLAEAPAAVAEVASGHATGKVVISAQVG